jgi:GNAT superfamily N-acetyltransferase
MTILYDNTASLSTMTAEEVTEVVALNYKSIWQKSGINPKWGLPEIAQDYAKWYVPRSTNRIITARDSEAANTMAGAIILMSTKESRAVTDEPKLAAWFVDNDVDIEKCCIPHVFVDLDYQGTGISTQLFTDMETLAVSLGFEDMILYGVFPRAFAEWGRDTKYVGRWSAIVDPDGVNIDPIPGDALPHAVRIRLV